MANPFLAMNEDYTSTEQNPALNPFLTGDFGGTDVYTENPFSGNNPFSDFGLSDTTITATTGIDFFGLSDPITSSTGNFFSTGISDVYNTSSEPFFSTAPSNNTNIINSANFFDTAPVPEQQPIHETQSLSQKPTDLDLSLPNEISEHDSTHNYLSDEELIEKPTRPPVPSRPIAPETKDLILQVTGHMQLTSTNLLNRLPPTRTPSPVSIRDLQSPSPTPDHAFGDFLTDSSQKKDLISNDDNEVNLFDVDDVVTQYSTSPQQNSSPPIETDLLSTQANNKSIVDTSNVVISTQEPSPKEETHEALHKPPRPGPPSRPLPPVAKPSRPAPPQKPPPPHIPPQPSQVPMQQIHAPQRPPPISSHQPPTQIHTDNSNNNDFSLFDAPIPQVHNKPTTKEDIMSLYSIPKKQEEPIRQIDFLTDDISEVIQPETAPNTEQNDAVETTKTPEETNNIIKEEPAITEQLTGFDEVESKPDKEHGDVENSNFINEESNITEPSVITPETVHPTLNYNDTITPQSSIASSQPVHDIQPISTNQSNVIVNETKTEIHFDDSEMESNPFNAQNVHVDQSDIFNANVTSEITTNNSNIFATNSYNSNSANQVNNIFEEQNYASPSPFSTEVAPSSANTSSPGDAFDAFSAKFESTANKENAFDAFGGIGSGGGFNDAWGNIANVSSTGDDGFGTEDNFDAFLSLNEPPPVPTGTPAPFAKGDSQESDDGGFNVFIKPREGETPYDISNNAAVPVLAPPPKSMQNFTDTSPRFNPFDKSVSYAEAAFGIQPEVSTQEEESKGMQRTDSQETPPTPLFDEDVSQPLEDFPRIHYSGPGWEVQLRQPNKKKITGQRFWKKIFVKLVYQGDNPVVQLFNSPTDKEPFQELPLQACYSVSDIAAQQYDQYGKIFTIKLQYVFYKERPGVRPGQVTKAERITNKLSQFAAYAIQGDYQGVKEFGSDLKKLGLPVEHAPQVSQLFKIGSTQFEDMKQFSMCIEEALFRLNAHRDRALHYKMEEVQITAVDELYVEQSAEGSVLKQIARVRLFFLGFLSGMPDVELGVNDMWRQGKEVVGRHDIIPVATEEWIRLEAVEFHSCIQTDEYQNTRIIRFKPPDACYIELMRFRVRPPKNRELPLQIKAVMCVTGNKVELRADCLVPGFTSRSLGQVPCEDVMIRFPIPECWIYLFRVEKHFRYGSVKSAHRRTGKIKGIERFLGTVDALQESLIEVTSGQAKYEHQHRSIVWRMSRLPKEGQGAYTTHNLVCRMALTSYDQIPENLAEWCYVEFTMPATQVSHTTVRSVSLQNHDSDEPPEKYVRYLARHEYKVGIEHTQGQGPNAYSASSMVKPLREEPIKEVEPPPPAAAVSSDSDSD